MIKINKFFIPYIILLIFIGFNGNLITAFIMVIFHEFTHYFVARYFGFKSGNVEILPFGAVLTVNDFEEASFKEDLIISLSGPIFNLVLAVIFYIVYLYFHNTIINSLFLTNAALGVFNLVPALPLDGGRIFRNLMARKIRYRLANFIIIIVSICIGSAFMLYYIYCFFKGQMNLSFGIIALYIIIYSFREKERIAYIIMSDIIKKKFKFIKRGYIENKSFSIYSKNDLLKALSLVEKNKYNIFTVLDDELRVIDIIYEEEILEALKSYGNITLEELVDIREKNEL
ncbi:putative metalloprotease [Clostridium pasteurianum DSM 525 = ATCC 6013]|uniref:Peptidase M50 n=1 Tax=Clostridium pasteurianum DSM 525 = ATCC 6013 TaxID=1262449 RepID=A0A0H3J3B0_CLOPA|nr:M50 family metallopeptidase [Clostridium pasteurianum]AJA48411.1 putative metalloprotease [Clostridium pasteurianum DSM 525 = ATCC 6013]AJA52399.1 putative metalloprotease [Clostridium pasteurianum DSM 525 = ATCC 6013]AOZ75656.1 metalloprotease [Clostridium pasteurianum DSM 525 = ATCC 6013]AOZ79452.1 metalloprotease [Clostridium pasteurianum]ELP60439.1 putative metalloprotease [Clostridium pasteurianum DSM 525 = ATCC 6013]